MECYRLEDEISRRVQLQYVAPCDESKASLQQTAAAQPHSRAKSFQGSSSASTDRGLGAAGGMRFQVHF